MIRLKKIQLKKNLGLPINRSFSLSRNKKNKSKTIPWKKLQNWDIIEDKKNRTLLQVLGLCFSPNFRYSSKCFTEIYRAQYENAILVYLRGSPIWRPENSVNIWNLLWISRGLIISTAKTNIYRHTFPNALNSKRAQNQEISIYFSTNSIIALCHAPPLLGNSKCSGFQTKQAIALKNCKQI